MPKYTDIESALLAASDTLDEICASVSSGGTLPEWCELNHARFGLIAAWINSDPKRLDLYTAATVMRGEWFEQVIFKQLRGIASLDIRGALNKDGSIKPPDEWPDELALALSGFEIDELKDSDGDHSGDRKKIKLLDKLRAIELLMKNRRMLSDRVEHSGSVSLEQLVTASRTEIVP